MRKEKGPLGEPHQSFALVLFSKKKKKKKKKASWKLKEETEKTRAFELLRWCIQCIEVSDR